MLKHWQKDKNTLEDLFKILKKMKNFQAMEILKSYISPLVYEKALKSTLPISTDFGKIPTVICMSDNKEFNQNEIEVEQKFVFINGHLLPEIVETPMKKSVILKTHSKKTVLSKDDTNLLPDIPESKTEKTDIFKYGQPKVFPKRSNLTDLHLAARLDELGFILSQTQIQTPKDGNSLVQAILDQMR